MLLSYVPSSMVLLFTLSSRMAGSQFYVVGYKKRLKPSEPGKCRHISVQNYPASFGTIGTRSGKFWKDLCVRGQTGSIIHIRYWFDRVLHSTWPDWHSWCTDTRSVSLAAAEFNFLLLSAFSRRWENKSNWLPSGAKDVPWAVSFYDKSDYCIQYPMWNRNLLENWLPATANKFQGENVSQHAEPRVPVTEANTSSSSSSSTSLASCEQTID